jgi:hypothetical protein
MKIYTSALTKNRSLIFETKKILQEYEIGMPFEILEKRILEKGILSPLSGSRIVEILRQGIKLRYFLNVSIADTLKKLLSVNQQEVEQLFYLYTARKEAILYDFITKVYYPASLESKTIISKKDVDKLFQEGELNGLLPKRWRPETERYIVQGLFQTMVDFGLLQKGKGEHRAISTLIPKNNVLLYLVYDLHFSGFSDYSILSHPDWQLFLMNQKDVHEELKKMSYHKHLIYQYSGDVFQITYRYKTMEEIIHAILGQ